VSEGQQDHGGVAVTVPVVACGLDKALDLALGRVFARSIGAVGQATSTNCSLLVVGGLRPDGVFIGIFRCLEG